MTWVRPRTVLAAFASRSLALGAARVIREQGLGRTRLALGLRGRPGFTSPAGTTQGPESPCGLAGPEADPVSPFVASPLGVPEVPGTGEGVLGEGPAGSAQHGPVRPEPPGAVLAVLTTEAGLPAVVAVLRQAGGRL